MADRRGFASTLLRLWHRSYAGDHIALVILIVGNYLIHRFIPPFHQLFRLDTRSIQYPHALVERVSGFQNIIYAGVVPFAILCVYFIVTRPGLHKTHVTLLGFLTAVILTSFITDIIKTAVGRPRPDLIDRCKPAPGTSATELLSWTVCSQTNQGTLQDGFRSFPSGHSSFAFSGLGYFALFVGGQFHIFRPHTDMLRMLMFFAPLLCAALIAISRLQDYRHDVYDVTCGSLLGFGLAWMQYRRYYPGLRNGRCDRPWERDEKNVKGKMMGADEESMIRHTQEFALDDMTDEEEEVRPLNRGGTGESTG